MEEGEVVVVFDVVSCSDSAFGFEPGVGAFDGPAVASERVGGFDDPFLAAPDLAGGGAGRERVASAARLADPGLDPALEEFQAELFGGVAAVCPYLIRDDPAAMERFDQRDQVSALVFVAT